MSTFSALEIGKRSMLSHSKANKVIGHNLSNANNKNYSRQRVVMSTVTPLTDPSLSRAGSAGQIGQGVEVTSVERIKDIYLDKRIFAESGHQSFWKTNTANLTDIERIQGALNKNNLQNKMDEFWQGWQEVSKNPSEKSIREDLVQKGISLTTDIKDKFRQMNDLRKELNQKIFTEVNEVNHYAKSIAELNDRISQAKAIGDNPNDLLDKRDALIEDLSKIVNVTTGLKDEDEFIVYLNSDVLVQGSKTSLLQIEEDINNESLFKVSWQTPDREFNLEAGSLKANLLARDEHLTDQIKRLDVLATNLIYSVNEIHNKGFDNYGSRAQNFFTQTPLMADVDGVVAAGEIGNEQPITAIYKIKGNQALDSKAVIGEAGVISFNKNGTPIEVSYTETETIGEVIEKINLADGDVSFYLDDKNYLTVKANRPNSIGKQFDISFLSDSGVFLSSLSGVLNGNTYDATQENAVQSLASNDFTRTPFYHPSSWISINENIIRDVNLVASREGLNITGNPTEEVPFGRGDNAISLEIAELRNSTNFLDGKQKFNEFYISMVDKIGSQNYIAKQEEEKYGAITEHLSEMRQSISGVNIDEEMANMLSIQHGYKAGAKIIKMMDEMLETLLTMS